MKYTDEELDIINRYLQDNEKQRELDVLAREQNKAKQKELEDLNYRLIKYEQLKDLLKFCGENKEPILLKDVYLDERERDNYGGNSYIETIIGVSDSILDGIYENERYLDIDIECKVQIKFSDLANKELEKLRKEFENE